MGFIDGLLGIFNYVRYSNGSNWYRVLQNNTTYLDGQDKLKLALNHSTLSSVISIRADYLSKAKFYIEERNGDKNFDDPSLNFINNPNPHQSGEDFLIQYEWFLCAYGWLYQRPYISQGEVKHLYNLNPSLIKFPKKMGDSLLITQSEINRYYRKEFQYTDVERNKSIRFEDVIPFFDVANNIDKNETSTVTSPSRLESVIREVSNVNLASDAENVTLQTNGKQIFFSNSEGQMAKLPLEAKDKEAINEVLNSPLGYKQGKRILTADKKIGLVDATIPIANLGLNPSRETNSNIIAQRFQVPNEIYKAFTKGDTFENQKQAQIGFVQNVIAPRADDIASSWTSSFGNPDRPFKASFDHLEIMQEVEEQKSNRIVKISNSFRNLVAAGLSVEQAVQFMVDNGIKMES